MDVYLQEEDMLNDKKRELAEQKALEKRKIEVLANELREAMLTNDIDVVDPIMQPLTVDMYNNVVKLLTNNEVETLNLIYNPPKFKVGSVVLVIDRGVVSTVIGVAWNVHDEYHMYQLQDIEGYTFRQEQISETNCAIDHNS